MLNNSADYALRAVLFVARVAGHRSCNTNEIAKALGVPRNYLGKVLHALTYARVLTSVRGPHGGFRLAIAPDVLTLAQVIEPFQRLPQRQVCLLGDVACDRSRPCESHRRWQPMADQITTFFRATTIADMLGGGAPAAECSAVSDSRLEIPATSTSTPDSWS